MTRTTGRAVRPSFLAALAIAASVLAILLRRAAPAPSGAGDASSIDTAAVSAAEAQLAAAEQRWKAHGPADYELLLRETCFCPPRPLLRVTVRGNVVRTELVPADSGALTAAGQPPSPYTVSALFDEVRQTLRDTDWTIDATYDSVLGYPRAIATSHRRVTDIGHGVQVLSLKPLSR